MRHVLIALTMFTSISTPAETVFFAGRIAQADVPTGYEHNFEDKRRTLVLLPISQKKMEIRFTANSLREYVKQRPMIGRDIVQDAASKKGKEAFQIAENGGIAFIDFTESRVINGENTQSTHGMMGLNDVYVTFTVTVADEISGSEAVRTMLATGIKSLLGRIKVI